MEVPSGTLAESIPTPEPNPTLTSDLDAGTKAETDSPFVSKAEIDEFIQEHQKLSAVLFPNNDKPAPAADQASTANQSQAIGHPAEEKIKIEKPPSSDILFDFVLRNIDTYLGDKYVCVDSATKIVTLERLVKAINERIEELTK